jgi:hypothetical protein
VSRESDWATWLTVALSTVCRANSYANSCANSYANCRWCQLAVVSTLEPPTLEGCRANLQRAMLAAAGGRHLDALMILDGVLSALGEKTLGELVSRATAAKVKVRGMILALYLGQTQKFQNPKWHLDTLVILDGVLSALGEKTLGELESRATAAKVKVGA